MEEKKLRPLKAFIEEEVPRTEILEIESIVDKSQIEAARKFAQNGPVIESKLSSMKEDLQNLGFSKDTQVPEERNEIKFFKQRYEKEIQELQKEVEELREKAGDVEVLQMYQHRNLLLDALNDTKERLIVISPWLNLDAINFEFLNHLQNALNKNIDIFIIYGFGDKKNVEEKALRQLNLIKKNAKKGRLYLHRRKDIHSKVLICDDKYLVITSLNWLSFAGDPQRGSRIEDGIKTTNKEAVIKKTNEWLERIKN
jgi:phosphatidylserine/phosphatidylglycerophosphate/cardiolipin synthase-like enzyme